MEKFVNKFFAIIAAVVNFVLSIIIRVPMFFVLVALFAVLLLWVGITRNRNCSWFDKLMDWFLDA